MIVIPFHCLKQAFCSALLPGRFLFYSPTTLFQLHKRIAEFAFKNLLPALKIKLISEKNFRKTKFENKGVYKLTRWPK